MSNEISTSIRAVVYSQRHGLCATATLGENRALLQYRINAWYPLAEWSGKETWGLAETDARLVTIDESQLIQAFDGERHTQLALNTEVPCFDVCALNSREIVIGGDCGELWRCNLESNDITAFRLGELGVSKPGRTILSTKILQSVLFIGGRRNLLVTLEGTKATELLLPGSPADRSLAIWDVAMVNSELWVSALFGVEGRIGRIENHNVVFPESQPAMEGAPAFVACNDDLWLARGGVWVYEGRRAWRSVCANDQADPFIAIVRTGSTEVTAVSERGRLVRFQ